MGRLPADGAERLLIVMVKEAPINVMLARALDQTDHPGFRLRLFRFKLTLRNTDPERAMARPTEIATITAEPDEAAELHSLAEHLDGGGGAVALKDALGHEVELPRSVARVFSELVRELADGNAVTIVPTEAELTTQQAADLLNLSRPYLVRLIDANEIASSKVGTHRRVLLGDVLEYKTRRDEGRDAVLRRMAERVESSGLEY